MADSAVGTTARRMRPGRTRADRANQRVASFAPVASTSAHTLILGSMPGERSLAAGEYYAHPQNAFWKIMGELHGFEPAAPYQRRLIALKSAGIALWDVLQSCERDGSLDAAIDATSAIPNEFAAFFGRYPQIRRVFFNGATAERYFQRQVLPTLRNVSLNFARLPSTSPAHAGRSYQEKLQAWRATRS